jgi:hypothetical protein
MIVRRDGAAVRLYSRNANDWTARLRGIADGAERIKANSFTINGEAVVLEPDGLSRFEELSRREAADTAILYAFDLIEHDGEDLRNRPFLARKAALARLLGNTKAGILNEHIVEDGAVVFAHACQFGAEGIGQHVSIRSVPRLDQGPQSRQPCGATGEERDLQSMRHDPPQGRNHSCRPSAKLAASRGTPARKGARPQEQ